MKTKLTKRQQETLISLLISRTDDCWNALHSHEIKTGLALTEKDLTEVKEQTLFGVPGKKYKTKELPIRLTEKGVLVAENLRNNAVLAVCLDCKKKGFWFALKDGCCYCGGTNTSKKDATQIVHSKNGTAVIRIIPMYSSPGLLSGYRLQPKVEEYVQGEHMWSSVDFTAFFGSKHSDRYQTFPEAQKKAKKLVNRVEEAWG